MTEHYTDHDLRCCGCLLVLASAAFTLLAIVGIFWLILG
jgi:hypothetical protein